MKEVSYFRAHFKLCTYNFLMFIPIVLLNSFALLLWTIGVFIEEHSKYLLDNLPKLRHDEDKLKQYNAQQHQRNIDHYNR